MSAQISITNRSGKAAPRLGDALRQGETEGGRTSKWPWRGFVFLLGLGVLFTALTARSSGDEARDTEGGKPDDGEKPELEVVTEVLPAPTKTEAPATGQEPTGSPQPASGVIPEGVAVAVATPDPAAATSGTLAPIMPSGARTAAESSGAAATGRGATGTQDALQLQGAAPGGGAAPASAGAGAAAVPADTDATSEPSDPEAAGGIGDLLADLDRILGRFPDIHAEQIMDYAIGDILREVPVERLFGETDANAVGSMPQDAVFRLSSGPAREELLPGGPGDASAQDAIAEPAAALQELGDFGFL